MKMKIKKEKQRKIIKYFFMGIQTGPDYLPDD